MKEVKQFFNKIRFKKETFCNLQILYFEFLQIFLTYLKKIYLKLSNYCETYSKVFNINIYLLSKHVRKILIINTLLKQ